MKKLLPLLTFLCSTPFLFAQNCDGQPAPEITLLSSINCNSNASSISAIVSSGTPPYNYIWSTGEITSSIGGLSADTIYSVTVTDANNCMGTAEVDLTNTIGGPELSLSVLSQTMIVTTCHGSEDAFVGVIVSSGTPPFTYQWSNGATTNDLVDVGPGVYTLVVTDASGCAAAITAEVFEPDELELIPTSMPSSGDNGLAAVNVQGGTPPYEYSWSNGDMTQIADSLAAGNYSVTVTDDNGCTISGSVTIGMYTNTINLDNLTQFGLSPNPSDGQFRIDVHFDAYQKFDIFVLNTLGQAVTQTHTAGKMLTVPIDIRDQNKGIYFVVIQTDKGQAVRKFLMR